MSDATYKVIKVLGEGSYGKAFLCTSEQDQKYCVIKQIIIEGMSEKERQETLNEATILSRLDHPNIVKFKEVFMARKPRQTINIVTEYADGGDLSLKIKHQNNKHMEENEILDTFMQICLAIKHIHDKKIIHRDLKSANIFLMKSGLVKLGDFGISKGFKNTWDKASTVIGTPYYLSPEIVNNKPYDFKSDIWSLGVLLYEMMALKMPFDAGSLPMLSLKIMRGNYSPLPSGFSKDICDLVHKLLSVDPNKRPKVDEIIEMPLIKNRIKSFLKEVGHNPDFSKTIVKKFKDMNKKKGKKKKKEEEKKDTKSEALERPNTTLCSTTNTDTNITLPNNPPSPVPQPANSAKNVINDKAKALAFFKNKSQGEGKQKTLLKKTQSKEPSQETSNKAPSEHRQELRNFLQAKKQTKKNEEDQFNSSGVMWPKPKEKQNESAKGDPNFPTPILVEKNEKGGRKLFKEDQDLVTSTNEPGLNKLIDDFGESFDVDKMNEDQYNQNRLLNNLASVINAGKEDSDNNDDDLQSSRASSMTSKDHQEENQENKIKIEENSNDKKINEEALKKFKETFKSEASKLEELLIVLEKELGVALLKETKNYVVQAMDPNEMKYDNDAVVKKIKENFNTKFKEEEIKNAIDKLPEIFAVVAMEKASNI